MFKYSNAYSHAKARNNVANYVPKRRKPKARADMDVWELMELEDEFNLIATETKRMQEEERLEQDLHKYELKKIREKKQVKAQAKKGDKSPADPQEIKAMLQDQTNRVHAMGKRLEKCRSSAFIV